MSERNPWTTVASREIYRNPWIRVREDSVVCPDGRPGLYGVVETKVATGVAALDEHGNILLIGQYRYPMHEYSWEIVEGAAEPGEDPLTGAKRELEEEGGLLASDWRPLGAEVHPSNCFSSERALLFEARGLSRVAPHPDANEVLQRKWMPLAEAVSLVEASGIKDALSIIAILRLAREMGI